MKVTASVADVQFGDDLMIVMTVENPTGEAVKTSRLPPRISISKKTGERVTRPGDLGLMFLPGEAPVASAGFKNTQRFSVWPYTQPGFRVAETPVNGLLMPGRYLLAVQYVGVTAEASFSVGETGREQHVRVVKEAFESAKSEYEGASLAVVTLDGCCPSSPALTPLLWRICRQGYDEGLPACQRLEGISSHGIFKGKPSSQADSIRRARARREIALDRRNRATAEERSASGAVLRRSGIEAGQAALEFAEKFPRASLLPEVLFHGYSRAKDAGDLALARKLGRLLIERCPDSPEVRERPSYEGPLLQ